mmetsp:Transcript_18650/g.17742  ORF Transcript_18650/g.17742 Transcript_18650/m.17742 type:complete len:256 (-) Transcript_18650:264-1031(-)
MLRVGHLVPEEGHDHVLRQHLMLHQAQLLDYVVVGFAFGRVKLGGDGEGDDHEGDKEVAEDTGQDGEEAAQMGGRVEVAVPHRAHGDDRAPHRVPNVVPVLLALIHVRDLCCADGVAEEADGDEEADDDDGVGALLELALHCEGRPALAVAVVADALGTLVPPHGVPPEDPPDEVHPRQSHISAKHVQGVLDVSGLVGHVEDLVDLGQGVDRTQQQLKKHILHQPRGPQGLIVIHDFLGLEDIQSELVMLDHKEQ